MLTLNGQTLQSLGVMTPTFDFVSMGMDTLNLRAADRDAAGPAWVRGQKVQVHDDGRLIFTGWVSRAMGAKAPGDHGADVTISGPWWWLTRITFGRHISGTDYTSLNLFIGSDGSLQDVRIAMREVLDWARVNSGNAFAIGTVEPLANIQGPAPAFIEAQYCDAVVKKIAGWCPESCLWVDYSQAVPVINWTAPGTRKTHAFTSGVKPLTSASMIAESDIVPSAVIVRYDDSHAELDPVAVPAAEDAWPVGASVGTPGAAVLTLSADDYLGVNFARKLHESAATFAWSGTAVFEGRKMDIKPGDLVSVSGRPEWAGSSALVQRVKFTPGSLITDVQMGPPSHLGLSDLRSLFWWVKKAPETATAGDVTRGSFEVYRTRENGIDVIKIAPGFVNVGEQVVSVTWHGRNLEAKPGPSEAFSFDYYRVFYLHIEWWPNIGYFAGVDSNGVEVSGYHAISSGTARVAEIIDGKRTNAAPVVNIATGKMRPGHFYFPIATVARVSGSLEVTQHRSNDVEAVFVAPNALHLVNG